MNYSYQHGNSGLEDQNKKEIKKQNQKIKKTNRDQKQKCKEKVRDPCRRGDQKNTYSHIGIKKNEAVCERTKQRKTGLWRDKRPRMRKAACMCSQVACKQNSLQNAQKPCVCCFASAPAGPRCQNWDANGPIATRTSESNSFSNFSRSKSGCAKPRLIKARTIG